MLSFFTRFIVFIQVLITAVMNCAVPVPANSEKLSFDANPSTGYSWVCEMSKEGIVEISHEYYKQDFSFTPVVGAGGTSIFIISPVKDGSTTLTFYYMRSWEGKDSAAEIVNYLATVKNGNVDLAEPVYG